MLIPTSAMDAWRGLKFWLWAIILEAIVDVRVLAQSKVRLIFSILFRFVGMMACQLKHREWMAVARKAVKADADLSVWAHTF
jgi:hypothetical protein